jgi:hypothetical protein
MAEESCSPYGSQETERQTEKQSPGTRYPTERYAPFNEVCQMPL